MCSFGYVIVDKNFNIKEKKDIVMNPRAKHNLGGQMKLAYPKSFFKKQKDFSFYYQTIKNLLENKNNKVFGFSLSNDIDFLYTACKRYKKPWLKFDYYDIKDIMKKTSSLDKLSVEYDVNVKGLINHKSDDDAKKTMIVFKEYAKRKKYDLENFVKEHKKPKNSFYYDLTPTSKSMNIYLKNLYKSRDIKGKKGVCFDEAWEKKNFNDCLFIAKMLDKKGVIYTNSTYHCNVFVGENEKSGRYNSAKTLLEERDFEIRFLTFKQFFEEYKINLKKSYKIKLEMQTAKNIILKTKKENKKTAS